MQWSSDLIISNHRGWCIIAKFKLEWRWLGGRDGKVQCKAEATNPLLTNSDQYTVVIANRHIKMIRQLAQTSVFGFFSKHDVSFSVT